MSRPGPRHARVPLVAGVLLSTLVAAWCWAELMRIRDAGRREIQQQADAVTDTLAASLAAQVRRGLLSHERVHEVLQSVVATGEVVFVRLEQPGAPPIEAGNVPQLGPPASDDGGDLVHGMFVHWERVKLQDAPLPWRHREPSAADGDDAPFALAPGGQFIVLGVPRNLYDQHVETSQRRVLATAFVGLVGLVLFGAAWDLAFRNRNLRAELERAQWREDHLQEMSLAAAGLAHETKNPLGVVRGLAQRMAEDPAAPRAVRTTAESILDEVDTAAARIGAFLAFAADRPARIEPVDAAELGHRVADLLRGDADARGAHLDVQVEPVVVDADRDLLKQLLVNLVLNAIAAVEPGGTVRVRLEAAERGARLSIVDDGCGIAPAIRERLFKPYVTTRPDGHGLGLAVVKRIVERHGWTIEVTSPANPSTGRGTSFVIDGLAIVAAAPSPEVVL